MKAMKSAKEYYTPPAKGKHPAVISIAEATFSKKGASMIHLTLTLEGASAGEQIEDWAITDGSAKGGGFGKAKLRGLGVDVESDAEIPDEQLAQSLLGRRVFIEVDHEQQMNKDAAGNLVPTTHFDTNTNQTIPIMRAVAKGYSAFNVGTAQAPAPQQYAQAPQQQFAQPPQYAQAPQQFAPQGYAPPGQPVPQFAQAPQYAPPQTQNYGPPPGQAPQQYAGQPPQYAQPGMPMQGQPQFAQPQLPLAQAPWAGQPAPTNGAAPAEAEAEGGKKRKHKIVDAPPQQ
jgi:hypothetical protein